MTGVSELRSVQVVSAAPDQMWVSVLGGRTQLDVALPADIPVASFLPELARLIESRDIRRDEDVTDRDERRSFWVLSRVDGDDAALAPEMTLRGAGVTNGELLRMSAQRALTPPTLYDDVVDAAARLNRAAYRPWNATAARVMAFAGLWLCTAVWLVFLVADALSAHRGVVVAGAAVTAATLVGGAAVVHRVLDLTDVAAAVGWPAIALSAGVGWALAARFGAWGLAAACAGLLVLTAVYYRVIGTGHWAYIAAAVVFAFGGVALFGRALGGRTEVLAAVAASVALLGCSAVTRVTLRLGRSTSKPDGEAETSWERRAFDNPISPSPAETSDTSMPSAEEVWARVRSAALTRAGLQAGLAAVVVVGAAVLLRTTPEWPALTFGLVCAAVLALHSRRAATMIERTALAVPATALVLIQCVQAQANSQSLRLAGVVALTALAVLVTLAGVVFTGGRRHAWVPRAVAYLEYVTAAAVLPLALWPLGVYDGLGPW